MAVLQHDISVRVRYVECDSMGIVHHSRYPVWFEMGRTEMCRAGGVTYRDLEASGIAIAVVRLEIDFKAPVRYDDVIRVRTELESMNRVKLIHRYEIERDGLITTRARTVVACVGPDGRPRIVPDNLAAIGGPQDAEPAQDAGGPGTSSAG